MDDSTLAPDAMSFLGKTPPSTMKRKHMGDPDVEGRGDGVLASPMSITSPTPVAKRVRPEYEDETATLHGFEARLRDLCRRDLGFPLTVVCTAVHLFKRFYVYQSAAMHPPERIMREAAYVAIKVDACPYREVGPFTSRLVAKLKLADAMELVEHEMDFLMGVRFELSVHHPFASLRGFLRELEAPLRKVSGTPAVTSPGPVKAEGEDEEEEEEEVDERGAPKRPTAEVFPSFETILKPLHTAATDAILASLTTDCALLYSPGQIALAALDIAASTCALPAPITKAITDFVNKVVADADRIAAVAAEAGPATGAGAGAGAGTPSADAAGGDAAVVAAALGANPVAAAVPSTVAALVAGAKSLMAASLQR